MSKAASVVAKYPLDGGISPKAHQNRLLASLPDEEFERLRPHLVPTVLGYKCPLYEANAPIAFVHFIETGVASLVNTMMNGDAAEVGTIGNEGFVGVPILFGDREAATSALHASGWCRFENESEPIPSGVAAEHLYAKGDAPLCPRVLQPNHTNGCLQYTSPSGTAMLSLAPDDAGSNAVE